MQNTLKNETPYDITYLGVNNMKKDALILAALIAANVIPVIGSLIEATEVEYESKLAMTLARDIEEIIEFVQLVREGITRAGIKQIINSEHLIFGTLQPLQAASYSSKDCFSVEMLIQIVTLTDQNGDVKFIGGSIIPEPGSASYISTMESIHDIDANNDIPWSSVTISNDIKIVIEVFDWIRKIIDAISAPDSMSFNPRWLQLYLLGAFDDEPDIVNKAQVNEVLTCFQEWVSKQDIPRKEFEATREKISVATLSTVPKLQDREKLVRFSKQCGVIARDGCELVQYVSYRPYNGLPKTAMLPTSNGSLLPEILWGSTELGGWNQSREELKKGGGLIYFPVMVTPPTNSNATNLCVTERYGHYWQRQSLHIHAPATRSPGVAEAFRYEDVTSTRRVETGIHGRFFSNTMDNWGEFTIVFEGQNPANGSNKQSIRPAGRDSFLKIFDFNGTNSTLIDLEIYVQQVQAHNIDKFNNPPGAVPVLPPIFESLSDRKADLITIQGNMIASCVNQIRSRNIADAINSFQRILELERFGESMFPDYRPVIDSDISITEERVQDSEERRYYKRNMRLYIGSYEEVLFQSICNTYTRDNDITSDAEFIKLLLFIYNLPLISQKIIAYYHIIKIYRHDEGWISDVHPNRQEFILAAFLKRSIEESSTQPASEVERTCFTYLKRRILIQWLKNEDKICLYNPWVACMIDAGNAGGGRPYAQTNYNACFSNETPEGVNPYLLYKVETIFDEENGQPNDVYLRFYNEKAGNYLDGGPDHRRHIPQRGEKENHYLQWRVTRSHLGRDITFFLQCRATREYLAPRIAEPRHTSVFEDDPNSLAQQRRSASFNAPSPREFGIFKSPKDVIPPNLQEGLGRSSDFPCVIS